MIYRIGSNALAFDALEKMKAAGLTILNAHKPWFPNGLEANLAIDRGHNHEKPELGKVRSIVLPVFLVAGVQYCNGISMDSAKTSVNYWASGMLLHRTEAQPRDYRSMTAGEALCALAQYMPVKSIQFDSQWFERFGEAYVDSDQTITIQPLEEGKGEYKGYVLKSIRSNTLPVTHVY